MNFARLFAAMLVNLAITTTAFGDATPDRARWMVERALAHIKAVGPHRAYLEFNLPDSKFVEGELYVFGFDFDGNTVPLGNNATMAGKHAMDMNSADNKLIIKDFIEIAKSKGEGWYDYKRMDPETKKIQDKSSYIKRIAGANAFLGVSLDK